MIDMKKMLAYFATAMKLKEKMQKKGVRRAYTNCPHCEGGRIDAMLVGPRNHMHARCSTPGCFNIME